MNRLKYNRCITLLRNPKENPNFKVGANELNLKIIIDYASLSHRRFLCCNLSGPLGYRHGGQEKKTWIKVSLSLKPFLLQICSEIF